MNHTDAISTAEHFARLEGRAFVVYRFPAWPTDQYGVIAVGRLPPQAQTFEVRPLPEDVPGAQGRLFS